MAISGLPPERYTGQIEWETLLFFAGLFILRYLVCIRDKVAPDHQVRVSHTI